MDLLVRVLIAGAAFAGTGLVVTRWPRLLLGRGPVPVGVLCVAAAAGALAADGAPTALTAVDGILRAALAALVTAASARARRQVWLFASTATVVAGTGAAYDWLAFIATGVTLAMLVLGRRSWIMGAIIGACLVQVLLRLELGGTTGTSASVAAAVAGLLIASGLRRARRSTRRRAWISAGVLTGAAVVFSAAGALAAARAAGDVRNGIDAGRGGLEAARRGDTPGAAQQFDRSTDAFGRAGADLSRWWVRPGLAVPVVGQQLRAARTLSAAGRALAGAAASAASELDLEGLRVQRGAVDLAALGRAETALGSARGALDRAAANIQRARSPWLLPPLVEAIDDLGNRMAEARRDVGTAADVLAVAGPMLGRDGPRRWFLAVVTPAENRGSGGLVGNVGEVTANGGKLELTAVARVAHLNNAVDDAAAARVLPSIYADAYAAWKVPARLQNVTVTADFPTAAEALEVVQPLAGRGEVDGTISVDPLAVAALLRVVGPVSVPGWPVPISADNAASVLLHEQYVALEGEARENFLGSVINAVWDRVITADLPAPAAVAQSLGPAVRGRHIQFHSRRADEQAALGRLGADGALRHSDGDHLALVTDNGSESKIDWFLRRGVDYRVRYDPGSGSAEATARITLTNDAPSSGLPAYVLGGLVAPPGFSRQIVQLYTPFDLHAATVDGRPPPGNALRSLGRPGNWAHELDVAVPPKSTIVIELRLSGRLARPSGRWTLDLSRQSAVRPDNVSVTLEIPGDWRIAGGDLEGRGPVASTKLELARNVRLTSEMSRR
ncbi:MAG TPA: DUF4012 domain-containing protein [Acidimicrobiia bacterium]|nr:DUF4012 domain-containing protein [Acidimicrobiia bacterium]